MFAFLQDNKNGGKDIIITKMVADDEEEIFKRLKEDRIPNNYPINSFVWKAMNEFYVGEENEVLFNSYADIVSLFKDRDDLFNTNMIKSATTNFNDQKARYEMKKISKDFTKLYYDILPIVRFEEVARYPVLGFSKVVAGLEDTNDKRRNEIYKDVLVSALENQHYINILKNQTKFIYKNDSKKLVKTINK